MSRLTGAQWAALEPPVPVGRKPDRPPPWTTRQLIDGTRRLADSVYRSRANRAYLRRRGVKATIRGPADQPKPRRRRVGGRPPAVDPEVCKQQHARECNIDRLNRNRAMATC
ncbi:hypothetical protein [Amycolatopsis thermophila]|uniref:Transposase n=1 Tax=Amycolatopsis thermophila TaxID=206084 RepID=A0ABU0F1E3_9PSEU|nr:hypothetical protein [Amycolatopsis thermophila]MDQ0381203.1 hypothetical protein [Amycolatopsis thermophila]